MVNTYGDYYLWGCDGGWMSYAWSFLRDWGAMTNADYPYTSGNTSTESACAHDSSKTVGNVSSWTQVYGSDAMKDAVAQRPLSIAIDAGQAAFQFYSSGVVTAADNCGNSLNHAVVIVGYTDSGSDPAPQPDPSPAPTPDVDSGCTVTKWWHSCSAPQEARRLQDAAGDDRYWKIQNSWGVGWGDQGFIKVAIDDAGDGVCGINSVVEYVEMA